MTAAGCSHTRNPPILLWIGFAVFYASTNTWAATDHLGVAVRKAARTRDRATYGPRDPLPGRTCSDSSVIGATRTCSWAARTLESDPGCWVPGWFSLSALLAPATFDIATREQIADAQTGVIPSVCLVGSIIALAGLLLGAPVREE